MMIAGIVLTSVGALTLAVSGVVYGIGQGKVRDAESRCVDRVFCSPEDADLGNQGQELRNVGFGMLAAGVAFLGVGIPLWAVGARRNADPVIAIRPLLGPGWLGARATF